MHAAARIISVAAALAFAFSCASPAGKQGGHDAAPKPTASTTTTPKPQLVPTTPPKPKSVPARPYDFDGNGRIELAVGLPSIDASSYSNGAVFIARLLPPGQGSISGEPRVFTQATPGIPGLPEEGDAFGYSVASADFDRDGYADLAIGTPLETRPFETGARGKQYDIPPSRGRVTVVHGSSHGLDTSRTWDYHPETFGTLGIPLLAGEFTGDRFPDLVAAARGDTLYKIPGKVIILPGGASGLSSKQAEILRQRPDDLYFGGEMTAGDFNGDGVLELVIGAAGGEVEGKNNVMLQRPPTLTICHHKQNRFACPVYARTGGVDLASGDITGDGRTDLVIGEPKARNGAGELRLYPGTRTGIDLDHPTRITTETPGVPATPDDGFGEDPLVGDIDHDGHADILAQVLLRGANRGIAKRGNRPIPRAIHLSDAPNVGWLDDVPNLRNNCCDDDVYGYNWLADYNNDGKLDIFYGSGREPSSDIIPLPPD